ARASSVCLPRPDPHSFPTRRSSDLCIRIPQLIPTPHVRIRSAVHRSRCFRTHLHGDRTFRRTWLRNAARDCGHVFPRGHTSPCTVVHQAFAVHLPPRHQQLPYRHHGTSSPRRGSGGGPDADILLRSHAVPRWRIGTVITPPCPITRAISARSSGDSTVPTGRPSARHV